MTEEYPNAMHDKTVSTARDLQSAQRIRLQRFGMALFTYVIVSLATFLVTRLGLGRLSTTEWATFMGVAVFGNFIFFLLFYTGANLRFSDPSLTREQIVYSGFWGMILLYGLPEARPVILMFYLPAYNFGILRLTLRQFFAVITWVMGMYAVLLGLEYYQQRPGFRVEYEIFLFALFGILLIWFASFGGFVSNIRYRLRLKNKKIEEAHEKISIEIEERKQAQIEKDKLIIQLQDALAEVKKLSGFLPICASCKKIRDDKGYWNQIEAYISEHSEAQFSHSICPECKKKLYPEL